MATLEGRFYKADKAGRKWQKRFFCLKDSVISWGKNKGKTTRGSLDISIPGSALHDLHQVGGGLFRKACPTNFFFAVSTHERELKVAFESKADMTKWKEALMQCLPNLVARVEISRGAGLVKMDINGSSDPYVKLRLCTPKNDKSRRVLLNMMDEPGKGLNARFTTALQALSDSATWTTVQVTKTETVKKNLNPTWDAHLDLGMTLRDVLVLDVYDHDAITADDSMGSCILLPEWFVTVGSSTIPTGRLGWGITRADSWQLHPISLKDKAGGAIHVKMSFRGTDLQQLQAAAAAMDESKTAAEEDEPETDLVEEASSAAIAAKLNAFQREQKAAITLQCAWRRHQALRRVRELSAVQQQELEAERARSAAVLQLQQATAEHEGAEQVAAKKAQQEAEAEAAARETLAIKLQSAWRARQARRRVAELKARNAAALEQQRRETKAALTIQAALRRRNLNRKLAARKAANEAEYARQEREARAMDSMRRMGASRIPTSEEVAAVMAAQPDLTETEAKAWLVAGRKLLARLRGLVDRRKVEQLRKERDAQLEVERAAAEAALAAQRAADEAAAAKRLEEERQRQAEELAAAQAQAAAARAAAQMRMQERLAKEAALQAQQESELKEYQQQVDAAVKLQAAFRQRRAKRRIAAIKKEQDQKIAVMKAKELATLEAQRAGLKRGGERNAVTRMLELEQAEYEKNKTRLAKKVAAAEAAYHKEFMKYKTKYLRLVEPARVRIRAATAFNNASQHRAARLKWEGRELEHKLGHGADKELARATAKKKLWDDLAAQLGAMDASHVKRLAALHRRADKLDRKQRQREVDAAAAAAAVAPRRARMPLFLRQRLRRPTLTRPTLHRPAIHRPTRARASRCFCF